MQYGLQWFNQDFSRGSLSATWTLRGNGNNVLESYSHALGATTEGWTSLDVTKTFTNPYSLTNVGNLNFSITGQDDRFWAGYYGPQVRNPYARLTYGVDQCTTNPLSSPTCAGFTDALASRTTAPTATEPATLSSVTSVTSPVAIVSPPAASATAPTTNTSATSRPAMSAARLETIARSVNEATAATVASTVQQSQEQAQQAERSAQDTATASIATGAPRFGATDSAADNPAAAMTRPGDPAAAARGFTPPVMAEPPAEARPQPRSTQPPAELAGGPSVTQLQAGVDITAYTNLALRDAAFYAPREIYRGQQTVDNRQALRGLGTDRLHQEMIDQQWRR